MGLEQMGQACQTKSWFGIESWALGDGRWKVARDGMDILDWKLDASAAVDVVGRIAAAAASSFVAAAAVVAAVAAVARAERDAGASFDEVLGVGRFQGG